MEDGKTLFKSTVVVGLGGIFSRLALILSEYSRDLAAAPKEITLADGDRFEVKNIERQGISEEEVGRLKAEVWAKRLGLRFGKLSFSPFPEFVTAKNVAEAIPERSIVLSGVDNHATRLLLSRRVQALDDAVLISGGNELLEGNVQLYLRLEGKSRTLPIEEVHAEMRDPKDRNPGDLSCEERLALPGGEQQAETNMEVARIMAGFFRSILLSIGDPDRWKEAKRGRIFAEVMFDLSDHTSAGFYRALK